MVLRRARPTTAAGRNATSSASSRLRDGRSPEKRPLRSLPEQRPVVHDDREDGPELHDDVERRRRRVRVVEPEQVPREHEVARGRHGQVLGDTLDDAEQDGDEQRHVRCPSST